jgi:hypothetical protein
MIKMPDDKSETVFRFNRARTVIPDRPLQGHLPVIKLNLFNYFMNIS